MDRTPLDINRLIGEVVRRNGIRLERDDPAFAVVTLNQLVLEETAAVLAEQFRATARQSTDTLLKVEQMAGQHLAKTVRDAAAQMRQEIQTDLSAAGLRARELVYQVHQAHTRAATIRWGTVGLLVGLLLFAAGFFVGRLPLR